MRFHRFLLFNATPIELKALLYNMFVNTCVRFKGDHLKCLLLNKAYLFYYSITTFINHNKTIFKSLVIHLKIIYFTY